MSPFKQKTLRHNNSPFVTKELRKEIMERLRLKNNYNNNRNYEASRLFKKQRNLCLTLLRKTEERHLQQINNYMEDKISNLIAGIRKSHGTQKSLVVMLEK